MLRPVQFVAHWSQQRVEKNQPSFNFRWSQKKQKAGKGAVKRQLLLPSITAHRAPPDWRPSRRRSGQLGGLITGRVGPRRLYVYGPLQRQNPRSFLTCSCLQRGSNRSSKIFSYRNILEPGSCLFSVFCLSNGSFLVFNDKTFRKLFAVTCIDDLKSSHPARQLDRWDFKSEFSLIHPERLQF